MNAIDRLYLHERYMQMTTAQAAHDPLARQLPDEPRFTLMARDPVAPGFVRLYAAVRERNWDKAREILKAIELSARQRPPIPHKDSEHAWSARTIADAMDFWRLDNMRGEELGNRINTLPERDDVFRSAPTITEIRNARPPVEPEEAS